MSRMSAYRSLKAIDALVIHCSATPNGRKTTAGDIDYWHRERGWERGEDARLGRGRWAGDGLHASGLLAIGYHFVIRLSGLVDVGRRLTETGAHALDAKYERHDYRRRWPNERAVGTCLVGTDQYTRNQWAALASHVRQLEEKFPGLRVLGHREINPRKTCPGFDVQAWRKGGMAPLEDHILEVAP